MPGIPSQALNNMHLTELLHHTYSRLNDNLKLSNIHLGILGTLGK